MNDLFIPIMIVGALSLAFALYVNILFLSEIAQKYKARKLGCNAVSSTLLTGIVGSLCLTFWFVEVFVDFGAAQHTYARFAHKVLAPGVSFFCMISALNLSLMWVQIATQIDRLKSGGRNLKQKTTVAVVIMSTVFGIIMLTLAILGEGLGQQREYIIPRGITHNRIILHVNDDPTWATCTRNSCMHSNLLHTLISTPTPAFSHTQI